MACLPAVFLACVFKCQVLQRSKLATLVVYLDSSHEQLYRIVQNGFRKHCTDDLPSFHINTRLTLQCCECSSRKKNVASSLLPASAKQCCFLACTQGLRVVLTASFSTWYTLWDWIDEEKSSLSCGRVALSHMLLPWPESLFSCRRRLDVTCM